MMILPDVQHQRVSGAKMDSVNLGVPASTGLGLKHRFPVQCLGTHLKDWVNSRRTRNVFYWQLAIMYSDDWRLPPMACQL